MAFNTVQNTSFLLKCRFDSADSYTRGSRKLMLLFPLGASN